MATGMNEYAVYVRTGDVKSAGTDANVFIIFYDETGGKTESIALRNFFKNNFERGNTDKFNVPKKKTDHLKGIDRIEVFRDDSGWGSSWYVENISVENNTTGDVQVFPIFRWVRPHYRYIFKEHDTCLPQDDEEQEQRKKDLEEKKLTYIIDQTDKALPAMITSLPPDEEFSFQYRWDVAKMKLNLVIESKITVIKTGIWNTLEDLKDVYVRDIFNKPKASELWKEDWFFGYQRLNGLVPNLIALCTKIPDNLAVTKEDLTPHLEGLSLEEAFAKKRLFCCDLKLLRAMKCKSEDFVICSPLVLLFVNGENQMVPIALQLFQDPGKDNPVFYPSDDKYAWLLAKMWYNHAEASYHQAVAHLGSTHLLMEGVCLALHRNISVSHPVYKLLAPHLLYLLPINKLAVERLLAVNGWIDKTMSIGREGVLELIRKGFKTWRLDDDWNLPQDLRKRGMYDRDVLSIYHYRDDAILFYDVIQKYVNSYIDIYYDTESLVGDVELQSWVQELVRSREDGGIGFQGVPGGGEFKEKRDVVETLTAIIFTSSVQHAAVNFPQYDYYGFPPIYPLCLRGNPPTDKKPRLQTDVLRSIPDKKMTFDSMIVSKILSRKGVKPLGDFEVHYIFDPQAREVVETFRKDLTKIGQLIDERNASRGIPYEYLHPDVVPNSISI